MSTIERKAARICEELAAVIEGVCRRAASIGPHARVAIGELRTTGDGGFARDCVVLTEPGEEPPTGQCWTVHGPWTAKQVADIDRVLKVAQPKPNLGHSISTNPPR